MATLIYSPQQDTTGPDGSMPCALDIESVEKPKIPRKSSRASNGPTDLYRFFCAKGDLIYVGISKSAIGRLLEHRETSEWSHEVATVQIEKFKTRKAAAKEEKWLIKMCQPRYNITHAPFVNRIRRRILKAHGSFDAWAKTF